MQRIAIVGIGCIFPDAQNITQFWDNILAGKDSSRTPPTGRWVLSMEDAYSVNPSPDKVYSKRACFIDNFVSDTSGLAIDKNYMDTLDPMFHLLLHAGKQAWDETNTASLNKDRVGVIVGNIVLPTETVSDIADEILLPVFESQLATKNKTAAITNRINRYVAGLPAGILARALQLGGGSYALDAACASSLYALKFAVDELQAGRADAMLCGGLSRPDCLYTQMGFSALHAISATGHCSPFDNKADGLVVGEGAGIVILKRLDDALRDSDHIYATVAGIGLSNDIKGNLMSPDSEGQLRAMNDAYQMAAWQPNSVELIECHGTGTPVGDKVEFNSLKALWDGSNNSDRNCVIGSVKSNIGHLLTAAGSAGLIKVLLALKHHTLPPTANFEKAADGIDLNNSPFTVLDQPRAWQRTDQAKRAAISAFGFGGINAHVLLEEWRDERARITKSAKSFIHTETIMPAIAVIGMDACFGPWDSLDHFQQRLFGTEQGLDPVAPEHWWGIENDRNIKGYFIDKVDVPLGRYRIPPNELKDMLPQQLLMLQVAANAINDAGLNKDDASVWLRTGVNIGIGLDLNTTNFHLRWSLLNKAREWNSELGLGLSDTQLKEWINTLRDACNPPLTADRTMGALGGIVASRIARAFNMGGPSFTVSSEESSGLRALEVGVRALQRKELNIVVVGAVDLAGDVRAVLSQHELHPFSVNDHLPSFDVNSAGAIVGEGATALVLKRHDDAIRENDHVYATIKGIGSANSGISEQLLPTKNACLNSIASACKDAKAELSTISYFEMHGSASPAEDALELEVLKHLFDDDIRDVPCALGSTKADIGHTGAASGLASVTKACLCLNHEIIPPLKGIQQPRPELQDLQNALYLPRAKQYWLRNRIQGPRRAMVNSFSVDGNCMTAILEGVEQPINTISKHVKELRPLGHDTHALFAINAHDPYQLLKDLDMLDKTIRESPDSDIHLLAQRWWQRRPGSTDEILSVNILAQNMGQLLELLAFAKRSVEQNKPISNDNVYYSPEPLGTSGKLAFVYPGSGNHFIGMGRDIACRWPDIVHRLDQENEFLAGQFANIRFWCGNDDYRFDHKDAIFGQVWFGTLLSDVISNFAVKPDAIIGYSLGETAGLFATRTWTGRDEMLRRMHDSRLFTHELAGPCEAARLRWDLESKEAVNWQLGMIDCPEDIVTTALQGRSYVYLLIINTANECVIGGKREAVQQLVADLGCKFHPINGVTTVHCEVAIPVKKAYRDLHIFNTDAPTDVTFYSGVLGRSYKVTTDSAADSIVNQALEYFDYTKVINSAYEDGVRIFAEMGPGATCSRMISQILENRPHIARSASIKKQDEVVSILRMLAQLNAERVSLDLSALYTNVNVKETLQTDQAMINVTVGKPAFKVPIPTYQENIIDTKINEAKVNPIKETTHLDTTRHAYSSRQDNSLSRIIDQMTIVEEVKAETQEVFLRVANGISETLSQALSVQMTLLETSQNNYSDEVRSQINNVASNIDIDRSNQSGWFLDRDKCLEFATGSISKVLGPQFAEVEHYPTRVRLPDEPLMLVDRILDIEGETCSMSSGRVVTEHDIHNDAWYLDCGRIPTCIAVEAGQADLFLSAYLGIDLQTKGLAVYRLLDAEVTFHGPLPQPGETIHYDIHIDHFFRQGSTYLFRFHFDGTVNDQLLITMRNGCAGFFSQAELDAGKGIVRTELEQRTLSGRQSSDWTDLVPMQRESYSDDQVNALRDGNLERCFGEAFSGLTLRDPVGLPSGKMTLVDRVLDLDPHGGRFGLGIITGEADIHPDDWFLTCHFVDDRVMPGTLMYECCLHTLRIYLLRMGWVAEANEIVYEPVIGINSQLKCRGQVIETTSRVQYEITLKEYGYQDDGTPYVITDALMYADGKAIVQMTNMSLQLTGVTRTRLQILWQYLSANENNKSCSSLIKPAIFDSQSILAFSNGKPSEAFGDRYKVFDKERIIARLPGPPYQFLDRIVSIQDCEPWQLAAGGVIEAQYDVPEAAWYFAENRQSSMPFAVLLEVALQPCGWLAAYLGSALTSDTDLSFRNLGGQAVQSSLVRPDTGTLTTRIKITNVSRSGGMIIQHFDYSIYDHKEIVYQGNTYFGFFTKQALDNQIGIRDASLYQATTMETLRARQFAYPDYAPYPAAMLRMVDAIELYDPEGGPHGLGYIYGAVKVDPGSWFFKAHFHQDPVWPGSLGLESLIQLLKIVAYECWGEKTNSNQFQFESMALGQSHSWIYRGQILPEDKKVSIQAIVTKRDDRHKFLRADGFLSVDGRIIYQMNDFTLKMHNQDAL